MVMACKHWKPRLPGLGLFWLAALGNCRGWAERAGRGAQTDKTDGPRPLGGEDAGYVPIPVPVVGRPRQLEEMGEPGVSSQPPWPLRQLLCCMTTDAQDGRRLGRRAGKRSKVCASCAGEPGPAFLSDTERSEAEGRKPRQRQTFCYARHGGGHGQADACRCYMHRDAGGGSHAADGK